MRESTKDRPALAWEGNRSRWASRIVDPKFEVGSRANPERNRHKLKRVLGAARAPSDPSVTILQTQRSFQDWPNNI